MASPGYTASPEYPASPGLLRDPSSILVQFFAKWHCGKRGRASAQCSTLQINLSGREASTGKTVGSEDAG